MPKILPFVLIPPLAFFGLVALFLFGMQREDQNGLRSTLVGQPAPKIEEIAVVGYEVFRNDMIGNGQVILVNFWASWCPPCRAEHTTLQKLSESGLLVYGVNVKDRSENAIGFLEEKGNPFAAIASDNKGRTGIDWGVTGLPETFIIDADGTVLFRFNGPLIADNYKARFLPELEKALAEN
jgi:cytochrome c biogenesis protein CcmG/thiol:disulfide interchange protein DsbE